MKDEFLLFLAAFVLLAVALLFTLHAAGMSREETECLIYTRGNAEACDPDGDLANGDYDAA